MSTIHTRRDYVDFLLYVTTINKADFDPETPRTRRGDIIDIVFDPDWPAGTAILNTFLCIPVNAAGSLWQTRAMNLTQPLYRSDNSPTLEPALDPDAPIEAARRYAIPFDRLAAKFPGFDETLALDPNVTYQPAINYDQVLARRRGPLRCIDIFGAILDKATGLYI